MKKYIPFALSVFIIGLTACSTVGSRFDVPEATGTIVASTTADWAGVPYRENYCVINNVWNKGDGTGLSRRHTS